MWNVNLRRDSSAHGRKLLISGISVTPKSSQNHMQPRFGTVVRTVRIWFKMSAVHGQISGRGQRAKWELRDSSRGLTEGPNCTNHWKFDARAQTETICGRSFGVTRLRFAVSMKITAHVLLLRKIPSAQPVLPLFTACGVLEFLPARREPRQCCLATV